MDNENYVDCVEFPHLLLELRLNAKQLISNSVTCRRAPTLRHAQLRPAQ